LGDPGARTFSQSGLGGLVAGTSGIR